MDHLVPRPTKSTIEVAVVARRQSKKWMEAQPKSTQNWLKSLEFSGEAGSVAFVPDRQGQLKQVVFGLGDRPSLWTFAALPAKLPPGRYAFDGSLPEDAADDAALGWALATYQFDRYRKSKKYPTLVWPRGADRARTSRIAEAIMMGRRLITTPAQDMGPAELVEAGVQLAKRFGGKSSVIVGDKLLDKNYPAIHAVGRAAAPQRAPRLFDMTWGDAKAPKVTLVGKGVCFDTGGLDLKPASGMKLMKKDMGGAASVLALAHMIMDAQLPVRLRVLIPAVENAVDGNAYRPGDVLSTRKGLTVEIGNTDAEGRLILCDALAEADTENPELLVDFATLTGAARVALGTELPALFCDDDALCADVLAAGDAADDPMWRMPLFRPYRRHLDSSVADLNNVASIGQGGAITAALFLREFVDKRRRWAHVDTMAYNASSRPGRPAGGDVFGVRAFFGALERRYAG